MRKLTIVFFDAGGGHRNAAEALQSTLADLDLGWDVSLLNLQELLDSLDVVRGMTGMRTQDAYNFMLRKGWTRLSPQLLLSLQGLIRLYHSRITNLLKNYWKQHPPDMVLSVIPHFNRAIAESVRYSTPDAPFVTLLTDLADYPPHFWMERESEYLICGTDRAKEQAFSMGHAARRVFQTSGMVLKPKFYISRNVDQNRERELLGLRPDVPTGLVLFGGHGSQAMLEIAHRLDETKTDLQLIMLCGHNEKLGRRLLEYPSRHRVVVAGFTPNVDHYMAVADFFIGKPGPGCISEALQMRLPVIVEQNVRTMPQERYNTQWIREKGVGIVLPNFQEIAAAVDNLLEPKNFAEISRNVRAYSNRALWEIPVILETIFRQRSAETSLVERSAAWEAILHNEAWAGLT
jgi:1,2-diacylglycerol 3-beta-galactosyltransferase